MTKTALPEANTMVLKLSAMLANLALVDNNSTDQPTLVPLLDQLAHATSSSMAKTNARHALPTSSQSTEQPVQIIGVSSDTPIQLPGTSKFNKLDCKEEPWLCQMTKTASPEDNTMVLKLSAMLVNHASVNKHSTDQPTLVKLLDQLVHATSSSMPKTNVKPAKPTLFLSTEQPVQTIGVSTDMQTQMVGKMRLDKLNSKEEL
jgi:hypothetical protein